MKEKRFELTMILDCHVDGDMRLMKRLDGASAMIYGIYILSVFKYEDLKNHLRSI